MWAPGRCETKDGRRTRGEADDPCRRELAQRGVGAVTLVLLVTVLAGTQFEHASPFTAPLGAMLLATCAAALVALRAWPASRPEVSTTLLTVSAGGLLIWGLETGGLAGPGLHCLALIPLGALVIGGPHRAGVYLAAVATAGIGLYAIELTAGGLRTTALPPEAIGRGRLAALFAVCALSLLFTLLLERARERASRTLDTTYGALEAARAAAGRVTQVRSQFLAKVSHEVRSPLTAILGFADVLGDRPGLSRDWRDSIEAIRRNARQLLVLVSDLLDLSRIEDGSEPVVQARVSLPALIAQVDRYVRPRAERHGVLLATPATDAVPVAFLSDGDRLRQILVNLLETAIGVTSSGRIALESEVAADADRAVARFTAVIEGGHVNRDPLSSLLLTAQQTGQHGGVRFVICQRLVALLGGTIEVVFHRNTCHLLVEIPVRGVQPLPLLAHEDEEKPEPAAGCRLDDLRILLVDDSADNRRLISHLLTRAGAQVACAENGRLGVHEARRAREQGAAFDVVLMDLQMPTMDGYAATRALRDQRDRTPIIAVTAHSLQSERELCLASGFDDYQSKPVDRIQLLQSIRRNADAARARESAPPRAGSDARGDAAPTEAAHEEGLLARLARAVIASSESDDPRQKRGARFVHRQTLGQVAVVCALLPVSFVFEGTAAWVMLGALSFSLPLIAAGPWSLARFGSQRASSYVLVAYGCTIVAVTVASSGGLASSIAMWAAVLPFASVPRIGAKPAIAVAIGVIASAAGLEVAQGAGLALESHIRPGLEPLVSLVALLGVAGLAYNVGLTYERDRAEVADTVAAARRARELIDAEIIKAAHAKEDLVANISHDVHSPMVAIVGFSEVLVEEALGGADDDSGDVTAREALRSIQRNSQRLLRVIEHLLELSRLDSGRFDVTTQRFEIESLAAQIAERARPDARAKGLTVEVESHLAPGTRLDSDPRRIAQIVRNLVQNAVEFTASGGVRIGLAASASELRIEVTDTGAGIPGDVLDRLFVPFEQADNSLTRQHGGAGLGLAISTRVAEVLGGTLRAESTVGQGSRFTLALPLPDPADLADDPAGTERRLRPWTLPPNWVRADHEVCLRGLALVVASAPDTRRFLAYVLRKAGLRVQTAEDPLTAFAMVNATSETNEPLDAILVHLALLGGDGASLVRKLRDRGYAGPIIGLHSAEAELRETEPAGCSAMIELPLARHALVQTVAHALAASREDPEADH